MPERENISRQTADLVVTNLNPRFTGVSATAAAVIRQQARRYDLRLAGFALPGAPEPISRQQALAIARNGPSARPFQIWHVRRNPEMQLALWARDVLRLPVRIVFTSAAQRRHSAWPRWLISRMDAVIATSGRAARHVEKVRAVVPHGVDTEHFFPASGPKAGPRRIACVGRVRPEKGTDRFVETALRLLPDMPDTEALIIGQAKPRHRAFQEGLKARVRAAGLGQRIRFLGEVPAQEMPALMRSLDLLLALPRYEGYGMTPLEAMASGVPVVASDAGHFREFIGPQGEAGAVLAQPDDPQESAAAVRRILSDGALHRRLADAARARAQGLFSLQHEVDGIADVYESLWAEAQRPMAT